MKRMILALTIIVGALSIQKSHAVVMPSDPEKAKGLQEAMKLNPGVWGSVNTSSPMSIFSK